MQLSNVQIVALCGFLIAVIFGAVARRTRFCTMGAISDWVNIGDTTRLRAWFLAIGVAICGAQLLTIATPVDLSKSIYLTAQFGWLGHLLGGFLFGVGMTLASGCGSRSLVLAGSGNLKSLVVVLVLAVTAYMTLHGVLAPVRLNLIDAVKVDLSAHAMPDQSVASLVAALIGSEPRAPLRAIVATVFAVGFVGWTLGAATFRRRADQMFAGVCVGAIVVAGWYITGSIGADEFEPVRVESLSFVAPVADNLQYLMTFTGSTIGFGVAVVFGTVLGSLLDAIVGGGFRLEGFASREDLAAHLVGGALMGFGGVCALGCTVGQGISGMSTLAFGSLLTLAATIFGCALTMKIQYHLLDNAGFAHALRFALADLRLIPAPRKPKAV